MKPDIHPEYRKVLFHDTSSDTFFLVGSTAQTTQTKEYEGQTYPYMTIDVSSASHPLHWEAEISAKRWSRGQIQQTLQPRHQQLKSLSA